MRRSILIIILFVIVLLLFVTPFILNICTIYVNSVHVESFYDWCTMIKSCDKIKINDMTGDNIQIPEEPHIILCNHIGSNFGLGSYLTLAGSITSMSNIVCYESYRQVFIIWRTIDHILRNEIKINVELSKHEKEYKMVTGIRRCLQEGNNVVMFIDAHDKNKLMRALNKRVLTYFPSIQKQFIHIHEQCSLSSRFSFERYAATNNIEDILSIRRKLVPLSEC